MTLVISYFSLVFSELAPKRLALQRPEGVSMLFAPALDRIATPVAPGHLAAVEEHRPRRPAARR